MSNRYPEQVRTTVPFTMIFGQSIYATYATQDALNSAISAFFVANPTYYFHSAVMTSYSTSVDNTTRNFSAIIFYTKGEF